jgi:hypothetical protein
MVTGESLAVTHCRTHDQEEHGRGDPDDGKEETRDDHPGSRPPWLPDGRHETERDLNDQQDDGLSGTVLLTRSDRDAGSETGDES